MSKNDISIALCRVSTAEQAVTGHSLERQEKSVYDAAERLGAPIEKVWSLDQSSRVGKNKDRKDLKEMLEFCRANRNVKYVIFDELDRFIRDADYFFFYKVSFQELGVKCHFASQPELNDAGVMPKLMQAVKAITAESSNEERITKSTNGLKARVRLGYYPFPVPQGYKKTFEAGLFEPDEPRFSLLQKGFRLVLAGKTLAESVRWLTENGYLTPQNKELNPNRFRELLKCPYYMGAIRIEGWEFTNEHGLHKAMITLEEFERLQEIIDKKRFKSPPKKHNREFPLSNLMECTECGGKMVGFLHRNGNGWIGYKYRCRGCKKQLYRRADMHAALDAVLDGLHFVEEDKAKFVAKLEMVWREGQAEAFAQIKLLEARKQAFAEEKRKYLVALAEYPQLKEEYLGQIAEVDKKLKKVDEEISDAKKIDEDLVEFTAFALDYVENLKENWWDLEFAEMKKCKQILFPAGFSINAEQKVYTPQISPLFRFEGYEKEPFRGSNLAMVEVARVTLASKTATSGVLHAQFLSIPLTEDETNSG